MNICLVGLPSAGKSSIINSLIGKRKAQSGVSRTTTTQVLFEKCVSDDDVKYNIYDLPGIADVEDTDFKYDQVIFDTIKKCNLVIWVSDISKAFITNHEKKEFEKIKDYIDKIAIENGIPVQLVILLSKVDKELMEEKKEQPKKWSKRVVDSDDELDCKEDTTIFDMWKTVTGMFKDIDVMLFNAYGRSYYNRSSSEKLKQFVKSYNPQNVNIDFNIKKYHSYTNELHDIVKVRYFIHTCLKKNITYNFCRPKDLPSNFKFVCCGTHSEFTNDCTEFKKGSIMIKCVAHNSQVKSSACNNYIYTNTSSCSCHPTNNCFYCSDTSARCSGSYTFPKDYAEKKDMKCQHGNSIFKCINPDYAMIAKEFMKIFKSLGTDSGKFNMINLILFDNENDVFKCEIKDDYNGDLWNELCTHIKITSHYADLVYGLSNKLSSSQIFRTITIFENLDKYKKLYLYTLDSCQTIKIKDLSFFKNTIYKLSQLDSLYTLKSSDEKVEKYGLELYSRRLWDDIDDMRKKIYGDIESDAIGHIHAYDKYGLFWHPK